MRKRKPVYVPLDFNKLWNDIKKHRKLYYVILPLAFLLAFGYQLGQPDYYTSTVLLSPELGQNAKGKVADINKIKNLLGEEIETDALFPSLYPLIVRSSDFLSGLLNVKIRRSNDDKELSYYDYILNYQKQPWWSFFEEGERIPIDSIRPFRLTHGQNSLIRYVSDNIGCEVDKKTLVILISFDDTDPLVSAIMADSIKARLQQFITRYHTQKAASDVKHYKQVLSDARNRYKNAMGEYSLYSDTHQDPLSENVITRKAYLEQEINSQFDYYSSVYSKLLTAESKLQSETPSFATLESASVASEKTGPDRIKKVVLFVFFTFIFLSLYVFYKEHDIKMILGLN